MVKCLVLLEYFGSWKNWRIKKNEEADFHDAVSITATGTAEEIKDLEKDKVLTRYLAKHPYLEDFAHSPSCALIKVTTQSYYMVKNFQNVMELHVD